MFREAVAGTLLVTLCACALPPQRTGGAASRSISSYEVQRERSRLARLARERQEEYRQRVERVGRRLLEHIPDSPRVQFLIAMGNPEVNAGATFGQVAVTSGLLDFLKNDDELAVVLGHELAHVTQGHVTKGVIGSLALNILAIVVESQAPGLGNTAGGIGQLFLNRYTQSQEREADRVGLQYVYQSGFDPRAAAKVQERLAVSVPQTMTAGYFDTHPSSIERMIAAREQASELLAQGPPPGRQEVLAMERAEERETAEHVAGGRNPLPPKPERRSSYRSEDRPDEEPPPRSRSRTDDCDRAESYRRRAEDTRSADEREELYRRAIWYCPSLAEAHAGLASVLSDQGQRNEAEREARRALELDPGNATAHDVLRR